MKFNCPQCGEPTETLHEGYCEFCRAENQNRLNIHNAQYDYWNKLTDDERWDQIRKAAKL